jgi:hypothetical protein
VPKRAVGLRESWTPGSRREALWAQAPDQGGLFDGPPKKKLNAYVPLSQSPTGQHHDESLGVLTLGEAAARLGVSRPDLEKMIAAGKI